MPPVPAPVTAPAPCVVPTGWPPYTFADLRAYAVSVQRQERLTNLRRVLLSVPAGEGFDLHVWATRRSCGFAGCAVGWAAGDAYFKAIGLEIECGAPAVRGRLAWGSADMWRLFRVTPDEVHHLFSAFEYDEGCTHDPRFVIERVDALLARYPVLPDPRPKTAPVEKGMLKAAELAS